MAPIRLKDNEEQSNSGCLSSIFSKFSSSFSSNSQKQQNDWNEKFLYSSVDSMDRLPPYEDIVQVRQNKALLLYQYVTKIFVFSSP
jgi:hypothetical protein